MSSQGNRMIRVLIVSDSHILRSGLRRILDAETSIRVLGEVNVEKSSPSDTIFAQQTDLILFDLDPRGTDILGFLGRLQETFQNSPVLILSDLADHELARKALSLTGTAGIVLKIQPPTVLIAAIKDLCPHFIHEPLHRARDHNDRRFLKNTYTADVDAKSKIESLTAREREVIRLIGLGLKNKEIANRLSISDITVRHHLTSIFCKLGVENRQNLLILAHRNGLADLALRTEPI